MTGRVVLFTLLAAGCAAAVPAAHGAFGGHTALHGGGHGAASQGEHDPETIRSRIDGALDALGLAPDARARAKAILESHFDEACALREKIHSGQIDHDAAMAEHERILSSAKSELACVLTPGQIRKLEESLHPHGVHASGR